MRLKNLVDIYSTTGDGSLNTDNICGSITHNSHAMNAAISNSAISNTSLSRTVSRSPKLKSTPAISNF